MNENNGTVSPDPQSTESLTLEIANKIFSQSGFEILSEFKTVAKNSFLSGAEELNFVDSEGSRNIINSWVEKETRNKIKDLIPSGKYVLFFFMYIENYGTALTA
jgi:serpin B